MEEGDGGAWVVRDQSGLEHLVTRSRSFRCLLHARKTGVDALDGLIGLIHPECEGQFEFTIGHGRSS